MRHSIGDGVVVASIAALIFGYLYLNYRTRIKRLELIHQERLMAMEKDFPLPELPLDRPKEPSPYDLLIPLILGIVLTAFGGGCMLMLRFSPNPRLQEMWLMPLPLTLMGLGLGLVHRLMQERRN